MDRTDNPDADVIRACTRKKAYDEKTARSVAGRIRDQHGADVVSYARTRCGRYHVGRRPAGS